MKTNLITLLMTLFTLLLISCGGGEGSDSDVPSNPDEIRAENLPGANEGGAELAVNESLGSLQARMDALDQMLEENQESEGKIAAVADQAKADESQYLDYSLDNLDGDYVVNGDDSTGNIVLENPDNTQVDESNSENSIVTIESNQQSFY